MIHLFDEHVHGEGGLTKNNPNWVYVVDFVTYQGILGAVPIEEWRMWVA